MFCSNVGDQLLDQYRLTYAGAAKQTDLTTLLVRTQQVDYLDTCLQDLRFGGLLFKSRRFPVDRIIFFYGWWILFINRLTKDVEPSVGPIAIQRTVSSPRC